MLHDKWLTARLAYLRGLKAPSEQQQQLLLLADKLKRALKIDAPMPAAEAAAASLIEQARVQGGARVSGHVERVRSGQAGRRIIEEAQDMRAAAVVMTLPRRVAGTSVFGKTIETVLAERPCRVIIESAPDGKRAARALEFHRVGQS